MRHGGFIDSRYSKPRWGMAQVKPFLWKVNMSDYAELKSLAEAAGSGEWGYDGSYVCPVRREGGTRYVETWRSIADCSQPDNTKFIAAANPAAVLSLIIEIERLDRESQNLSSQLGACDRKRLEFQEERDQLKSDVKALRKNTLEIAEAFAKDIDSFRKDAERYRFLCDKFGETKLPCAIERILADDLYVADGKPSIDSAIDAAMSAENED